MEFIESEFIKSQIISDIFDVDEFILNIKPLLNIDDFNFYDVRNFMNRHSFVIYKDYKFIGQNIPKNIEYTKRPIDNDEFLKHRGVVLQDVTRCGFEYCSTLNYNEFNGKPLLDFITTIYSDNDVKPFLKQTNQWIDETIGDESKRIRLKNLIDRINESNSVLKKLKTGWGIIIINSINPIQEKVIEIHEEFNKELLKQLHSKYGSLLQEDNASKNKKKTTDYGKGYVINRFSSTNYNQALELLKGKFINNNTSKSDFLNAFSSSKEKQIEKPIVWVGSKKSLNYLISNLKRKNVICKEKYKKTIWKKTENIFKYYDRKSKVEIVMTNVKGNGSKVPTNDKVLLDKIIDCF